MSKAVCTFFCEISSLLFMYTITKADNIWYNSNELVYYNDDYELNDLKSTGYYIIMLINRT